MDSFSHSNGVTVVYGGQAGSEGKGAIAGYLARRQGWAAAACTFMTNAGHTWLDDDGTKVVVQQLPVGLVGEDVDILVVGAASAITLDQLFREIDEFDGMGFKVSERLVIDPRAVIIEPYHVDMEKVGTKYLASTMKGCGAALADKVRRKEGVRLARDIPRLRPFLREASHVLNSILDDNAGPILVEAAQGFDLDINHGIEFPYCTSRGTTPMQVLADLGIDGSWVDERIAVLRTYPIRVGNVIAQDGMIVGYSGPFKGRELTWAEITARAQSDVPIEERTTVTQRVRRVFEISPEQVRKMAVLTRPTQIALTFADYLDADIAGKSGPTNRDDLSEGVADFVSALEENVLGAPVRYLKTGPHQSQTVELFD